jgi:ankyrin repeat protein
MKQLRAGLCLVVLMSMMTTLFAAEQPTDPNCQCPQPKDYSREPTQQVIELFAAARAGDEATFNRLIDGIDALAEYAVEGQTLVAALLWPTHELIDATRERGKALMSAEDVARVREQHARTLPAKTRMLKRALERGASAVDSSYLAPHPPLHLAMVFGTPEFVQLLLDAGVNPDQPGDENKTPIEFALGDSHFVRMMTLPQLVERAQLTKMLLQLVRAGAQRPYARADAYAAEQPDEPKLDRPVADYLLWPALAELTTGTEVLDAFVRLGTSPALDPGESLSVLAHAARAGNLDAVRWFKSRLPRTVSIDNPLGDGSVEVDLWLNAAIWALHPDPREPSHADAILRELLVKDMPWVQGDPVNYQGDAHFRYPEWAGRISDDTILHHLVELRRDDWLRRLFDWGVPVDTAARNTPLAEAVRNVDLQIAELLLDHGADPLAGERLDESPLFLALRPYQNDLDSAAISPAMVELLVGKLGPQQRARLEDESPVAQLLRNARGNAQLVRTLIDAGLKPSALDGGAFTGALNSDDPTLLDLLLKSGIRIQERAPKPDSPLFAADSSVLVAALRWQRTDLLPRLLDAGANPNHFDLDGVTPVNASMLYADVATLDLLLSRGGKFLESPATISHGRRSSLDFAVASGNVEMLKRVRASHPGSLAQACLQDMEVLLRTVMQSSDEFWRELEAHGFTDAKARERFCPDAELVSHRLMLNLLQLDSSLQIGWPARRLSARLRSLIASPKELDAIIPEEQASLLELSQQFGRTDLVAVLIEAGATPLKSATVVQSASKADKALEKKLAGHYYLYGVREVGSEILLRENGRFEYMLAYGALDELASGTWQVLDGRAIIESDPSVSPPVAPYAFVRAGNENPELVTVRTSGPQSAFAEVSVDVYGCEAPHLTGGHITAQVLAVEFDSPICFIVLSSGEVDGGRAFAYEVPPEQRSMREFEFAVDPTAQRANGFRVELEIDDDELVLIRSGRAMRYRKQ